MKATKTNKKMDDFNKETALDELLASLSLGEKPTFSAQIKAMQTAQNYLEAIYLEGFRKGLETGLKKLGIENESN